MTQNGYFLSQEKDAFQSWQQQRDEQEQLRRDTSRSVIDLAPCSIVMQRESQQREAQSAAAQNFSSSSKPATTRRSGMYAWSSTTVGLRCNSCNGQRRRTSSSSTSSSESVISKDGMFSTTEIDTSSEDDSIIEEDFVCHDTLSQPARDVNAKSQQANTFSIVMHPDLNPSQLPSLATTSFKLPSNLQESVLPSPLSGTFGRTNLTSRSLVTEVSSLRFQRPETGPSNMYENLGDWCFVLKLLVPPAMLPNVLPVTNLELAVIKRLIRAHGSAGTYQTYVWQTFKESKHMMSTVGEPPFLHVSAKRRFLPRVFHTRSDRLPASDSSERGRHPSLKSLESSRFVRQVLSLPSQLFSHRYRFSGQQAKLHSDRVAAPETFTHKSRTTDVLSSKHRETSSDAPLNQQSFECCQVSRNESLTNASAYCTAHQLFSVIRHRLATLQCRFVEHSRKDGNEQFRALSFSLFGTEVCHMSQYKAFYAAFFTEGSFAQYLLQVSRVGNPGDQLSACAAAEAFQCSLHVVTDARTTWYWRHDPDSSFGLMSKRNLFLCCIDAVSDVRYKRKSQILDSMMQRMHLSPSPLSQRSII